MAGKAPEVTQESVVDDVDDLTNADRLLGVGNKIFNPRHLKHIQEIGRIVQSVNTGVGSSLMQRGERYYKSLCDEYRSKVLHEVSDVLNRLLPRSDGNCDLDIASQANCLSQSTAPMTPPPGPEDFEMPSPARDDVDIVDNDSPFRRAPTAPMSEADFGDFVRQGLHRQLSTFNSKSLGMRGLSDKLHENAKSDQWPRLEREMSAVTATVVGSPTVPQRPLSTVTSAGPSRCSAVNGNNKRPYQPEFEDEAFEELEELESLFVPALVPAPTPVPVQPTDHAPALAPGPATIPAPTPAPVTARARAPSPIRPIIRAPIRALTRPLASAATSAPPLAAATGPAPAPTPAPAEGGGQVSDATSAPVVGLTSGSSKSPAKKRKKVAVDYVIKTPGHRGKRPLLTKDLLPGECVFRYKKREGFWVLRCTKKKCLEAEGLPKDGIPCVMFQSHPFKYLRANKHFCKRGHDCRDGEEDLMFEKFAKQVIDATEECNVESPRKEGQPSGGRSAAGQVTAATAAEPRVSSGLCSPPISPPSAKDKGKQPELNFYPPLLRPFSTFNNGPPEACTGPPESQDAYVIEDSDDEGDGTDLGTNTTGLRRAALNLRPQRELKSYKEIPPTLNEFEEALA